jgi:chemotaxis family two-component system response regulator Rcp1
MVLTTENQADISILLIEDDKDDQYIVKRAMQNTSHSIFMQACVNGAEGLNHLEKVNSENKKLPDIIILDLNMPVMDGREFLRRLRNHDIYSDIPVIVLTTSKEPEILKEARDLGANATLSKGTTMGATEALAVMIVDYWFSGTIDWHLHN